MNEKWNSVVTLAREQNTHLVNAIKYSKDIFSRMESLTKWTEQQKQQLDNKDYAVDSINDLLVKNKKFKVQYNFEKFKFSNMIIYLCLPCTILI